jgi:hypothetical protein
MLKKRSWMSDPFESFIEAQLHQHLGPLVGSAIPPHAGRFAAAAVGAGISASAGSGIFAALSTKTAAGIAAASIAAGGGGAVAATVATGSSNPAVWGRQVQAAVTQCKTELSPGERGVGHCVSHVVAIQQQLLPSPSSAPAHASDEVIGGHIAPPPSTPTPKAKAALATPTPKPILGGDDSVRQSPGGDWTRARLDSVLPTPTPDN